MAIRIDYTNMMAPGIPGGITEAEWASAASKFADAHVHMVSEHSAGTLGFLDLPDDTALHAQVTTYAVEVHARSGDERVTDVVVLGIGGSALGPIALRTSLRASKWNELDDAGRGGWPKLHVLDNVDPVTIDALLARLDAKHALFVVISKSGGTAETMAQYMIIRQWLERTVGADGAKRRLVLVTDPQKGALRKISNAEGITALDIPSNVGGRFSVLTPVGLLPAALMGVDTSALLAGAAEVRTQSASKELTRNIAGVYATLQWLSDTAHGRHIHVLMPYSDPLRDMADWFVQLWAESLGKHKVPGDDGVGPTPFGALGATDQHSKVQLFMEGPMDKTISFISVEEGGKDIEIPKLHADIPELAYLGGHHLGELLDVERRATAGALARRGRPNLTISIERVDAHHVGALMMFLEMATVYAGALYGVDPMNQPGVELGKNFTYAIMGRPDADQARQEWNLLPKPDPRYRA